MLYYFIRWVRCRKPNLRLSFPRGIGKSERDRDSLKENLTLGTIPLGQGYTSESRRCASSNVWMSQTLRALGIPRVATKRGIRNASCFLTRKNHVLWPFTIQILKRVRLVFFTHLNIITSPSFGGIVCYFRALRLAGMRRERLVRATCALVKL